LVQFIARAKGGYYNDVPLEELVSTLIQHIVEKTKIDKNLIDEVCFGKGNHIQIIERKKKRKFISKIYQIKK
jgi:acetyl-CoA acetyltransferase